MITLRDISWGFDAPPLLENINLTINKGERICLLGRNGAGKSTLLKIIAGQMTPDQGEVQYRSGIRISWLAQAIEEKSEGSVFDIVASGWGDVGVTLVEYRRLCDREGEIGGHQKRAAELRMILDKTNGWEVSHQTEQACSSAGFDPLAEFATLSAGNKRQVLLIRALSQNPDVLLLDEPTNHLDIDTILWMEKILRRQVRTLLFVTHDRMFVSDMANRILDLDRGRLSSYAMDYSSYVKQKEADLLAEQKQTVVFEKKLSQEEQWIRKGIKARRTRNEGRVRALKKMREAYRARRNEVGRVHLQTQEARRSGKLVIRAKRIGYAHQSNWIIKDFSYTLMRGDKVGIIGPNGVGKTTLINLLLKKMIPDNGCIRHGTHLEVAYFDQLRGQLDGRKTVAENISADNDFIVFNGKKRHIISYLKDFQFTSNRCLTPVRVLSGGEKNRLLLAKLFIQPANVLVLDEPTNDLDVETLELLEELLFDYAGTILLVSHDRFFLNNVVTSTLVFEGRGRVVEYAGGYDDWLFQRPQAAFRAKATPKKDTDRTKSTKTTKISKKLGYMEQRELDALPTKIENLEAEYDELSQFMTDPLFYRKRKNEIQAAKMRFDALADEIEKAYQRWDKLEKNE